MASWKITFEGQVHREADLTLGQAERIEDITGTDWRFIHPLRSAKHAKAVLVVMHGDATGEGYAELLGRLSDLTAIAVGEMIEDDEDDLPEEFTDGFPPPAAEPSTPT